MKAKFFILSFFITFFAVKQSNATYTRNGTYTEIERHENYVKFCCIRSDNWCWTREDDGTVISNNSQASPIPGSLNPVIYMNGLPFYLTAPYSDLDFFEIYY